jgi:elongation factor P
MEIDVNSIKKDDILEYEDRLWSVLAREHVKPGKGGAFVQAELKDILSGTKRNERFRSEEKVIKARIDEIDYHFLYEEDDTQLVLMHPETFEQETFSVNLLKGAKEFLQDNMILKVGYYETTPIWIKMPDTAVYEIIEAEPVIKGQTATSSYKPASLANGVKVKVPPFIGVGEKVVIKIEDGTYVERAK